MNALRLALLALLFAACDRVKPAEMPLTSGDTRVTISWKYQNFPTELTIHEIRPGKKAELWQTGSGRDTTNTPVGEEIKGGVFAIQPGKEKNFVLAARNSTGRPIYFFAAPHHLEPAHAGLGFQFKCLCVNHLFEIKPGEIWYRVVRLRITRENRAASIDISHDIVGVDKKGREGYLIDAAEPEG